MLIAEFADEYDVPHARVHRSVRSLAHEAFSKQHGTGPHGPTEEVLREHRLDVTLDQGVRVTSRTGSTQFSYEVVDEEALFNWLRQKYGQKLLSAQEVERLLDYMEFLLKAVLDEGVRRGGKLQFETIKGDTYQIPWTKIEEMERILWRAGRTDEKKVVPREGMDLRGRRA